MKTVILTKGLPGSGKTYWAKELMAQNPGRYKRINKDDLRAMIDDGKWSKHNEQFILKVRNSLILAALEEGCHVIVDDTNLHSKHEQHIRDLVKGLAAIEVRDFTDVPLETCLERDRKRQNYVGEKVITSMYRQFLQVKPVPPAYHANLPEAIICDLDGTLALMNGRNPYDAEKCESDLVNEPIADIIERTGHSILLVSGRSEVHRPQTEAWLEKHHIRYMALFMRPEGDMRKDAIVKRELYENYILGQYNINYILDDREQMVRMWRDELGLTCLQVADGDY
jgi:predicted kinase